MATEQFFPKFAEAILYLSTQDRHKSFDWRLGRDTAKRSPCVKGCTLCSLKDFLWLVSNKPGSNYRSSCVLCWKLQLADLLYKQLPQGLGCCSSQQAQYPISTYHCNKGSGSDPTAPQKANLPLQIATQPNPRLAPRMRWWQSRASR